MGFEFLKIKITSEKIIIIIKSIKFSRELFQLIYPETYTPPFLYGTVEGGNTHETMKRNWLRMNQYVTNKKLFRDNISAGIQAVKNE